MVSTAKTQGNPFTQKPDCKTCLTRSCVMNGLDNCPVTSCNTFRLVNCGFCATNDCPFVGTINSPVLDCSSFQFLGAN